MSNSSPNAPKKTMHPWLKRFYQLGAPHFFYPLAGKLLPWLGLSALVLWIWGTTWGLFYAPKDYQQSDAFRIIYIHVPAAWMSMLIYLTMGISAAVALIWRVRMAEIALMASVPIGMTFTAIALLTGAIWGKPMWGAWWVWDARLTSELILLFLYLGIYGLYQAFDHPRQGARAASILAVVGLVNLPIIHYSVEWWHTLHQGATISLTEGQAMHPDMLWPLLIMAIATKLFYGFILLMRMQTLLLRQDARSGWVKKQLTRQTETRSMK